MIRVFINSQKWTPGVVVKRLGPVSYLIQLRDGSVWKRHSDHIRVWSDQPGKEQTERVREQSPQTDLGQTPTVIEDNTACTEPCNLPPESSEQVLPPEEGTVTEGMRETEIDVDQSKSSRCPQSPKRYPRRSRKPPDRYINDL